MRIRNLSLLFIFLIALFSCREQSPSDKNVSNPASASPGWVIVVHGGAGNITPKNLSPERQKAYMDKLTEAIETGAEILKNNGAAIDAVEAAIRLLEDSPLFNAGKGAGFDAAGINEMDASIMDGKTLNAGAVAGVTTIKNPVSAARAVMEKSEHVMLIEKGAEKFAEEQGLEIVDPSYFFTEKRWQSLQKAKKREQQKEQEQRGKWGTVGCVALDMHGDLAAATSTGGMTNKKYGRVGDSPIIGAGTYADNRSCAVSCTGHGEYFIRNVVAYDISARMLYKNQSLQSASDQVINHILKDQHASGGIIAVDKDGNIAMPFNTPGMFRGFMKAGAKAGVFIFEKNNSN